MEQADFRMPATGEGWRHYKGKLYTIVGMAVHTENDQPIVIYTEFGWALAQRPGLYARPLEVFLELVSVPGVSRFDAPRKVSRFEFERETGCDPKCPFYQS